MLNITCLDLILSLSLKPNIKPTHHLEHKLKTNLENEPNLTVKRK